MTPKDLPELTDVQAFQNTDREVWRETPGDFYSNSVHLTATGGLGINVGGTVYVKPPAEWHRLASGARSTAHAGSPLGTDADWALAIKEALGSSVEAVPIVPTVEGLRKLFDSVRSTAAQPADDMVQIPRSALRWLFGEEGEFECPERLYFRGKPPGCWWRAVFREKIAAPAQGDPSGALRPEPEAVGQGRWQPIDTAPKDGAEFLAVWGRQGNVVQVVRWNRLHRCWQVKGEPAVGFQRNATAWHPLPEPHQAASGERGD